MNESHVQHLICFVQNQPGQILQAHMALIHKIKQPPGRRDHDIRPRTKEFDLRVLANPAVNHGASQFCAP